MRTVIDRSVHHFSGCDTKSLAFPVLFYAVFDIHRSQCPKCRLLFPNATSHIGTSMPAALESTVNEGQGLVLYTIKLVYQTHDFAVSAGIC